jgi:hypothetical protein
VEVVLLVGVVVLGISGCIQAIVSPRRIWHLRYGRYIKNAEPTEEALPQIRRFGYFGLIALPLIACAAGYGIYRSAESRREFEQRQKEFEERRQEQEEFRKKHGFRPGGLEEGLTTPRGHPEARRGRGAAPSLC